MASLRKHRAMINSIARLFVVLEIIHPCYKHPQDVDLELGECVDKNDARRCSALRKVSCDIVYGHLKGSSFVR